MPARPNTDLISLENAAAIAAMQTGYDRHVRQQAEKLEGRNRAIVDQYARGGKVQFISADYGLSQDRVRKIIAENGNPIRREKAQPSGATSAALYRPETFNNAAKLGSADLLAAILHCHLRHGTWPAGMGGEEFIARCRAAKIRTDVILNYIDRAEAKATTNAGAAA